MLRVLVEIDGSPEGYGLYRVKGSWDDDGISAATLDVIEAMATSLEAEHALWSFLFGVDLVTRVKALFVPVDHPLKFMMRDPRHLRLRVRDGLWLRVVDVTGALEARSYAAEGRLIFEIVDDFCPWNAGVWELRASDDGATVRPSNGTPELALTVEDLAATYLGGTTYAQLTRAGRVKELTAGAVDVADRLFRTTRAPWCPEIF